MNDFKSEVLEKENFLKAKAQAIVNSAVSQGADECSVSIGGSKGLSVSSRDKEVENIEFNSDNGMDITVYVDHRRGGASTTDLSEQAVQECIKSALAIAEFADKDECAGICDKDLICTENQDLELLYETLNDPDKAVKYVVDIDRLAVKDSPEGIKASDGAGFDSYVSTSVIANSHGMCLGRSPSRSYVGLTLLGESNGGMQRGSGYDICRDYKKLKSVEEIIEEARARTLEKLNATPVETGKYNIIFSEGAAASLWGHLFSAISGRPQYQRSSFLLDALGQKVTSDFITVNENPFVKGEQASRCYDSEGVRTQETNLIENGILKEYLLASYSSRKLKSKSNGHASGLHNIYINADSEKIKSKEELMQEAGEGLVITDLMGQGVDIVSGNYSRGASGFYFKNGKRVHAVEGITIAGNLKEMLQGILLIGNDIDNRFKIKTGSLLMSGITVSGS